eukprot:m.100620 g.100620  ORF g.100620 m.100620 type:complete len:61 (-) comp9047_c8_seq2:4904-5086(-)
MMMREEEESEKKTVNGSSQKKKRLYKTLQKIQYSNNIQKNGISTFMTDNKHIINRKNAMN